MTFRTESTLAGYARAAVDARIRQRDHLTSRIARETLVGYIALGDDDGGLELAVDDGLIDALDRATQAAWADGDLFVLAPAMTAIIAAAAQALDLTGDLLDIDAAPGEHGVLLLPEPIYCRLPTGRLKRIAAVSWTTVTSSNSRCWVIGGWYDTDDPDIAEEAQLLRLSGNPLGPYMFAQLNLLPIAEPVEARDARMVDEGDVVWESAPDGSVVITDTTARTDACAAIAYAFWRIQAQPLAIASRPPVDRATRRRAERARVDTATRIVMLRRTKALTDPSPDGEAKWHYKVRFYVRGHWRHLHRTDGQPYKIWIHTHIKGPDGAPLLQGEKVNILAR